MSSTKQDRLEEGLRREPPDVDEGALLIGWVVVCEWMLTDGKRILTRLYSAETPSWTVRGWLSDALDDLSGGAWEGRGDDEG